jgi:hypothetical protein
LIGCSNLSLRFVHGDTKFSRFYGHYIWQLPVRQYRQLLALLVRRKQDIDEFEKGYERILDFFRKGHYKDEYLQ